MRVYQRKFLFNLAKIKINSHEIYIRILILKFKWEHRLFAKGTPCSDIKPHAFIRVHNEKNTLKCSLDSIVPAIAKGVVAYHDCTDGSEEIILEFCRKNRGFIPARYDFFNLYGDEPIAEKLTRYYNWTLSLMPRNEWLVKIDADQIYDSEKLKAAFRMVRTTKDVIILPRIQLHHANGELFVISDRPFNFSGDHWVIFNDGNMVFEEWDKAPCESLVILDEFQRNVQLSEAVAWHFPLMKSSRTVSLAKPNFILFDDWTENWNGDVLDTLDGQQHAGDLVDRKMLIKERVMEYTEHFAL